VHEADLLVVLVGEGNVLSALLYGLLDPRRRVLVAKVE